jgi:hypothetical protein
MVELPRHERAMVCTARASASPYTTIRIVEYILVGLFRCARARRRARAASTCIFPDKSEAKKGRGECRVRCQKTRFHLSYTTLGASN